YPRRRRDGGKRDQSTKWGRLGRAARRGEVAAGFSSAFPSREARAQAHSPRRVRDLDAQPGEREAAKIAADVAACERIVFDERPSVVRASSARRPGFDWATVRKLGEE